MSYFEGPIDLILIHVSSVGFLDYAMFVEIIIRDLHSKVLTYGELFRFH